MAAGVVSYMLLCWGSILCGLVILVSYSYPSPYSSELIGGGFFGLPPGFCYVCVCVGMAHLFYGSGYLVSFFCFLGYWSSCSWCVSV